MSPVGSKVLDLGTLHRVLPHLFSDLRVGRHNSRGAGPVSAAGAPGTEGKARAGPGAGGQEPGGSSGRDAAAGRCGVGRRAGPWRRRGRGGTALCYCFCQ